MSRKVSIRPDFVARHAASLAAAAVLAANTSVVQAQERPCEAPGALTRISGKISNNVITPAETLGIGSTLIVGRGKMTCGLQGRAFLDPDGSFGGFVHTIVCDDSVPTEGGDMIHSQIVAVTRFDGIPDFQSCGIPGVDANFGSFREISEPQSGRGIFSPTGGGRIFVEGTLNCAGMIDLTYNGEACVIR